MNSAIATKLASLLEEKTKLVSWQNIPPAWQAKIQRKVKQCNSLQFIAPRNTEELGKIIQFANEHNLKILPCGRGSKLGWGGRLEKVDLVISSQNLNNILEYAVGDLTLSVEAGAKLADIQNILAKNQQFLPLDPSYSQDATIGGILATADAGSWRQRYGGVRDLVLGVSFLRSDGKLAKAGGKVVKNVAGYDLMKLFTGSYGTLGFITQVNFRLYPLPANSQTIILTGSKAAVSAIATSLHGSGLTPSVADLISGGMLKTLDLAGEFGLVVRFQTIPASIEAQIQAMLAMAKDLEIDFLTFKDEQEIKFWCNYQANLEVKDYQANINAKIGILPHQIVQLLENLTANELAVINLSSGIGKLKLSYTITKNRLQTLRSICQSYGGFLTILSGATAAREQIELWGYQGNNANLMRAIKQKFDPKNILSPGTFIDNI